MSRLTVLLVGLLLVATGCGTESDGDTSATDSDAPQQVEPKSAYDVASMVVDGQARTPVAGTRIILDFTDGTVTAKAGCNTLFGKYTFDDKGLEIAQLGGTEMGCAQDRMQQDDMLGQLLPGHWEVTGTDPMTLRRDGAELTLSHEIVRPTELQGTTWKLDSLIEGDSVSSAPSSAPVGTTASLTVDADGKLKVDTGCNTGGGSVKVGATTLEIGPLMTTKMACTAPEGQRTEAAFTKVLDGTVDYTIEGNRLTLTNGGSGLGFTAK